ncbi:VLTF-2 [Western grey kangaroopox virus]|uniref:Viral late gene transcription factor 2 n=1 Tax=Western grey kangaroopox virus TaxID=1566307 RepID=A0A2C9DSQ3_9POXV|nr:VLTF-2 [Western grey kangaroopox virus]ATI21036.1 VLTF-2 [Western grey kangaroopox virus]
MYRKVNLRSIVISEPKAAKKFRPQESISCVLPEYYHTVACKKLRVCNQEAKCWFCLQEVLCRFKVETLHGGRVGSFCSRICRDSFAGMIKGNVALREEPKVTLLPLQVYENPDDVLEVINALRETEGVYGTCFLDEEENSVRLTLRSLM